MLHVINAVRKSPSRKSRLLSLGFLILFAATALIAFPGVARADVLYRGIYRNWETGRCLDSNYRGNAYVLGCNRGNYQNWSIDHVDTLNGWIFGFRIINNQTGRCLDSDFNSNVYTLPCNGGDYQVWWMYGYDSIHQAWFDKATGRVLDDNSGYLMTQIWANRWGVPGWGQWRPGL